MHGNESNLNKTRGPLSLNDDGGLSPTAVKTTCVLAWGGLQFRSKKMDYRLAQCKSRFPLIRSQGMMCR